MNFHFCLCFFLFLFHFCSSVMSQLSFSWSFLNTKAAAVCPITHTLVNRKLIGNENFRFYNLGTCNFFLHFIKLSKNLFIFGPVLKYIIFINLIKYKIYNTIHYFWESVWKLVKCLSRIKVQVLVYLGSHHHDWIQFI